MSQQLEKKSGLEFKFCIIRNIIIMNFSTERSLQKFVGTVSSVQ